MIITAVVLLLLHYSISYILPWPWNNFNILFLAIVLFIMGWESESAVWLGFILHFFIELYSITPFGLVLFSSTISIFATYKLYILFFTNRSWYSALALSASAILIYRIIYTILFIILEFSQDSLDIVIGVMLLPYLMELVLTSITAGIVIFILSRTIPRFQSGRINF